MGSYGQNEKPNFDQKISLFQPSNLSKALILEPKGPQPPYIWASLGSLDLDQSKKKFGGDHLTGHMGTRHLNFQKIL